MDITDKTYSGRTWSRPGQLSTTKADSLSPDFLHLYATTEDNYSQYKAVSVVPAFPFNLTHTPKGAGSYQGGAGTYIWGGLRCWAWDAPEALTTGTLTIDGAEVAVIPEKSITWMDWQYGPGYASEGWYSFVIALTNGVKITTMTTYPNSKYPTGSVATLGFPDGHHEVYALDRDFHPADPWVSKDTNVTYYKSYQVNVPAKGISLNVSLAMEGGELYNPDTEGIIIADTFSYFEGTYEGLPVTGWGNSERMSGNSPNV
ncbi:uncharacterized protein BDZ99DRAFT_240450 [Mytilinidion resinicola]|uniref:Uncharacterized protein n=1 Tax=Mytilinidion resinicola TaxID=574789 RepID=A0A6A6XYJ0_9PEZI|nr:uncharacterized protein BDZ99DRAFT_240450 [Mytilinidion resinicola]KAF2801323.1 hypothetical protein BDZ99DRAFT_240450 [Mytilinidion resinicola]